MPLLAPATIQLALTLLADAPQFIGLVQHSFDMFTNGNMTEAELAALWQTTTQGFRAEVARWNSIVHPAMQAQMATPKVARTFLPADA